MNKKLRRLYESASASIHSGNTTKALSTYSTICKIDSDNYDCWYNYGMIAGKLDKLDVAERAFKKAKQLTSDIKQVSLMLTNVYEARGEYGSAAEELQHLHQINPSSQYEFQLGNLYGKSGDYMNSIHWFEKYLEQHSDTHALHCVAAAYEAIDDTSNAALYYERAIASADDPHIILNNYGAFLHKNGQFDNAIDAYNKSIHINNRYHKSYYNLATTLHATGEHARAQQLFNKAISLMPDDAAIYVGLGKTHRAFAELPDAASCYRKAIELDNTHSDAYANLGLTLMTMGDFTEAMKALQTAVKIDPGNLETESAIAKLLEHESKYDEAQQWIDRLLPLADDNPDIAVAFGAISRKTGRSNDAIQYLQRASENNAITHLAKSSVFFQLGKLYDDKKDYRAAFKAYATANRLLPYTYDEVIPIEATNSLKSIFNKTGLLQKKYQSTSTAQPIFIFGMPRSGTSLTEQILSSHHDVHGCGELAHMTAAVNHVRSLISNGDLYDFSRLKGDAVNDIATEYYRKASTNVTGEARITDKMPHNFQYLGAIQMLFPKAKLIHVNRNPIDNCLSIFFSDFNILHPYSASLKDSASYYKNIYLDMMEFWRNNLTLPVYELHYGRLVENQEDETRKLLEFCELEWDDNCLNYHKANRSVTTLSYDQVKQPIYTRSKERWKNYRDDINDLISEFPEYSSD